MCVLPEGEPKKVAHTTAMSTRSCTKEPASAEVILRIMHNYCAYLLLSDQ